MLFSFLSLAEIIDALEQGDSDHTEDIFIEPPDVNNLIDEDSGVENEANVNSLSRAQLLAPAQRMFSEDMEKKNCILIDKTMLPLQELKKQKESFSTS